MKHIKSTKQGLVEKKTKRLIASPLDLLKITSVDNKLDRKTKEVLAITYRVLVIFDKDAEGAKKLLQESIKMIDQLFPE